MSDLMGSGLSIAPGGGTTSITHHIRYASTDNYQTWLSDHRLSYVNDSYWNSTTYYIRCVWVSIPITLIDHDVSDNNRIIVNESQSQPAMCSVFAPGEPLHRDAQVINTASIPSEGLIIPITYSKNASGSAVEYVTVEYTVSRDVFDTCDTV